LAAVAESRCTTPDSFIRLPSISVALSGADCGTSMPIASVTMAIKVKAGRFSRLLTP